MLEKLLNGEVVSLDDTRNANWANDVVSVTSLSEDGERVVKKYNLAKEQLESWDGKEEGLTPLYQLQD